MSTSPRRRLSRQEREERYARRAAAWNPGARIHYVYMLRDAEGGPLYVGRSSDPLGRLRTHHSHPTAEWAARAVDLTIWGPYNYADVLRYERETIAHIKPSGNVQFVRPTYKLG